jgi:membrane protease YdiL (CAAX protease family)
MNASRFRALALAAGLVIWSGVVGPRIPPRWQMVIHASLAGVLVRLSGASLGLAPPALRRGLRLGLPVAALVSATVAGSTALPLVRTEMADREHPAQAAQWLLLRIPIGTVWSEEAAFRAALGAAAAAFGPRRGRLLQAAAFGLSHIADARRVDEPIVGTVLVTGIAGWAFGWLHERSGSLAAPMLAHLALNEAGAVVAMALQRRG